MQEFEEMDAIVHNFLKNDDTFNEDFTLKEQSLKKNSKESLLSFYDNFFYSKFDWKTFNKQKIILYKRELPQKEEKLEDCLIQSAKNCKEISQIALRLKGFLTIPNVLQQRNRESQMKNNKNRRENVFSVEEKEKNSTEINSFFENDSSLKNSGFLGGSSFLSLKNLKNQNEKERKKDVRLMSKRYYKEFPEEYKPKILTTNLCKKRVYFIKKRVFLKFLFINFKIRSFFCKKKTKYFF